MHNTELMISEVRALLLLSLRFRCLWFRQTMGLSLAEKKKNEKNKTPITDEVTGVLVL